MPERFNPERAWEESEKMKKLVGKTGSKDDYDAAEKLLQEDAGAEKAPITLGAMEKNRAAAQPTRVSLELESAPRLERSPKEKKFVQQVDGALEEILAEGWLFENDESILKNKKIKSHFKVTLQEQYVIDGRRTRLEHFELADALKNYDPKRVNGEAAKIYARDLAGLVNGKPKKITKPRDRLKAYAIIKNLDPETFGKEVVVDQKFVDDVAKELKTMARNDINPKFNEVSDSLKALSDKDILDFIDEYYDAVHRVGIKIIKDLVPISPDIWHKLEERVAQLKEPPVDSETLFLHFNKRSLHPDTRSRILRRAAEIVAKARRVKPPGFPEISFSETLAKKLLSKGTGIRKRPHYPKDDFIFGVLLRDLKIE